MKFLIVEDDAIFRRRLVKNLRVFGEVTQAKSLDEGLEAVHKDCYDLCFIDLNLEEDSDEYDGLAILEEATKLGFRCIILTSHVNEEVKIRSYKYGCSDYIVKSKFIKSTETFIKPLIRQLDLSRMEKFFSEEYITSHFPLIEAIEQLLKVVTSGQHSVLITGETGVGKTTIAKLIHELTVGDSGPFIYLNIGQLSQNLLESELFGTTKGAFTGATDKAGFLEKANGGTLFLDEIDALPKSAQVKIQVALEEGRFNRLGSSQVIESKFRLISATCHDLFGLVKSNKLREDFFYRIKGYEVNIPPLRERAGDIELISRHLMKDLPVEMVITSEAFAKMRSYQWPGNIRELKDFILSFHAINKNFIDREEVSKGISKLFEKTGNSGKSKILSSQQKEVIQEKGLQFLIDLIESEAVREAMEDCGSLTSASEKLQIGNRRIKRIYDAQNREVLQ